jgi:DNA-binding response OmpR family regulator
MQILLVDDDNDLTKLLLDSLKRAGYKEVDTADSGEEALEALKEKRHELVVLDMVMAGIGGEGFLDEYKSISPYTKVIILTGHPSPQNIIESLAGGIEARAVYYAFKPVNIDEILQAVDRFSTEEVGDFRTDTRSKEAYYRGQRIEGMTAGLFDIFAIFARSPERFFKYPELVQLLTGEKMSIKRATRYLGPQMSRLRELLREVAGGQEVIITKYGHGFGWNPRALYSGEDGASKRVKQKTAENA